MRFDEIKCYGPLYLERLSTLTTWTSTDQNRLVLIEDSANSTYELYLGDQTKWRRLDFPVEDLTGDEIYVTYDGTNFSLSSSLPTQTGHDGHVLKTNGTEADWAALETTDLLPGLVANKFLTNDGSTLNWDNTPSEIASKAGHEGEVLVVDSSTDTGTAWNDFSEAMGLPSKVGHSYEFLQVNGDEDDVLWNNPFPTYTGSDDQYLKMDSNSNRSWVTLNTIPDPSERSVLMTDGSTIEWSNSNVIPDQTDNEGNVLVTDGANLSWTDITDKYWIVEDTTWIVPTNYATIQLAIDALDNYYIHPKATLTISLLAGTHNIATPVTLTNRGIGEGNIFIQGVNVDTSIITSSDFGAFNSYDSFFTIWHSKVRFQDLTINGNVLSVLMNGISCYAQSYLDFYNVKINDFTGGGVVTNWNSQSYFYNTYVDECGIANIQAVGNSNVVLYGSSVTNGLSIGIDIINARAYINGCNIESNSLYGIRCMGGGSFRSSNSTTVTSNGVAALITNGSNGDFVEYSGSSETHTIFSNNGSLSANDVQVLNHSFADLSYTSWLSSNGPYQVYANGLSLVRTYNSKITTTAPTLNSTDNPTFLGAIISSAIY